MSAPGEIPPARFRLHVGSVAIFVVAALVLSCFHVANLDIGGHVTVGREILKTHAIPDTDFFTHTIPGLPYPVHQWLGEVLLFGIDHLTGHVGLILLRMMLILGCSSLLFHNARRGGAPVVVASAIVLLLLVAARPRFFVRPFLVTVIFLPLLQTWISDFRAGHSNRLWRILPLMTIWGHLHSGVVFGVLFLFGTIAGEAAKILVPHRRQSTSGTFPGRPLPTGEFWKLVRYAAIAIFLPFSTVALVNPSGVKPLLLPFLFFRNDGFRSMIAEYRSVDLAVDWPFGLVAGAVLLGMLIRPKRVDLTEFLVTAGFGYLAFEAVRAILPFAVVSAPLLGRTWGSAATDLFARFARGREGPEREKARGVVAFEAVVVGVMLVAAGFVGVKAVNGWMFPFGFGKDPRHYPERALDFLDAQSVRGPIFNTDIWASSMLWRWHGRTLPIFVDARLEAYPEEFWRDKYYRVLQTGPGWYDVLDEYGIQSALLRREPGETDDRIGTALWKDPRWGLVYWDDYVVIYVRRGEGTPRRNAEVLDAWEFRAFDPRRPQDVEKLRGPELVAAANSLAELAEWSPESFLPWWTLAVTWTRLGEAERALAVFDRLSSRVETERNADAFQRSWAEAELVNGDRGAWAARLRSIRRDPAAESEVFAAASVASRAGNTNAAIDLYRDFLTRAPDHADAMNNLAVLLAREPSGVEPALELLERAIASHPSDPYYLASRGEVHWRAGNMAAAEADLQRAYEMLPADDAAAREEVSRWLERID